MTANQLKYWELKETARSNRARETETERHNVSTEGETVRHNLSDEAIRSKVADQNYELGQLAEHNKMANAAYDRYSREQIASEDRASAERRNFVDNQTRIATTTINATSNLAGKVLGKVIK